MLLLQSSTAKRSDGADDQVADDQVADDQVADDQVADGQAADGQAVDGLCSGSANQIARRTFLSAVSACLFAAPATSESGSVRRRPSDQIHVGVVGLGSRGFNLLDGFMRHPDCRIVALCDVDRLHYRDNPWGKGRAYGLAAARDHVAAGYAKSKSGALAEDLFVCSDFRDLIAREDIDVVVVATPDHLHALCSIAALKSGKDVYCEKPVTHLFAEGQQVVANVKEHGRVFQTGSQQRSDAGFRRAVELVRNGLLGQIHTIEVGLPKGYDQPQGDTSVVRPRPDLDYEMWCGPSPTLPLMQARHHRWWRGHTAYGGGVLMDWIGHHNDIAHWAMDLDRSGPMSVEAVNWVFPETDIYNTPHQYTIRCEYAGGIVSTISTAHRGGLKIIGSAGWLWVDRGKLETSDERWRHPGFVSGSVTVTASDDHVGNFLQCVRSRQECIAPADVGHRSVTPGHLGYVSQQLGRRLLWDAAREEVQGDEQANRLLNTVNYRDAWQPG